MAIKQFDFALFQELKLTKGYKENYFKQAKIKNAKEALFFIDYKMAGKKEDFLMIPFKKKGEGKAAFFTNKSKVAGSHLLKKTCYGVIEVAKIAGKQIVVVDIKRGGISPDILEKRLNKLFEDFGLDFVAEVVGQNAIIAEDTDIQTNPSSPEDKKNSDKLKKIITNLSGVKQYIGKKGIHELEQLLAQNKSDLELRRKKTKC